MICKSPCLSLDVKSCHSLRRLFAGRRNLACGIHSILRVVHMSAHENRVFVRQATFCALIMSFSGCVMLCPSPRHSTASGIITGTVLDSKDRPVAEAEVQAVYLRGWTTFLPPVPNGFVVGVARTDRQGRFRLVTDKRVDQIWVHSERFAMRGELHTIRPWGNVIIVEPRRWRSVKNRPTKP